MRFKQSPWICLSLSFPRAHSLRCQPTKPRCTSLFIKEGPSRSAIGDIITVGNHTPHSSLWMTTGYFVDHASSARGASSAFSHCLFLSPPFSGPPGASPSSAGTPAAAAPVPVGSSPAVPPGTRTPSPAAPAGPPLPPAPAAAGHIHVATAAALAETAASACVCWPAPPFVFPDSGIFLVPEVGLAENHGPDQSSHSLAGVTYGALCGCPG